MYAPEFAFFSETAISPGAVHLGCHLEMPVVEPCPIPSRKADSKPLPDNNSKHEPPIFVIGVGWPQMSPAGRLPDQGRIQEGERRWGSGLGSVIGTCPAGVPVSPGGWGSVPVESGASLIDEGGAWRGHEC